MDLVTYAISKRYTDKKVSKLSEEIVEIRDEVAGGAADVVRYTEQTLTDAQKTQARMNLWQEIPSTNLYDPSKVTMGKYIDGSNIYDNKNLGYTYIRIAGAGTYSWVSPGNRIGFANDKFKRVYMYANDYSYIKYILGVSTDTESAPDNKVTFTVTEEDLTTGAVYFGFNVEKTMVNSAMVVKADTYPSAYIPFAPTLGIPELNISTESVKALETNPLYGKVATFTGDSICESRENNGGGYATIIGDRNAMTIENLGVSGGKITAGTDSFCISESVNNMRADADYVILEGGVNDMAMDNLGEISSNFNATLDTTTFCGAFEQMVKAAIARFPGKKIGYIAVHRLKQWAPDDYNTNFPNTGYYEAAIKICKKWGIPVCDLMTNCPSLYEIDSLKQAYTTNADGWHPNAEGYLRYYVPKIEAWMKTL